MSILYLIYLYINFSTYKIPPSMVSFENKPNDLGGSCMSGSERAHVLHIYIYLSHISHPMTMMR